MEYGVWVTETRGLDTQYSILNTASEASHHEPITSQITITTVPARNRAP